jgi:hypothetical protein
MKTLKQEAPSISRIVGFIELSPSPASFVKAKVVGVCKAVQAQEKASKRREKEFKDSNLKGLMDLKRSGGELKYNPFKGILGV